MLNSLTYLSSLNPGYDLLITIRDVINNDGGNY